MVPPAADGAGCRRQGGAVGARHAEVSELATAVALRDKATVARAPGVGPKLALRIVTELKDKAPAYAMIDPAVVHLAGASDEKRAPRPVMRCGLGAGQSRLRPAAGRRRDCAPPRAMLGERRRYRDADPRRG